MRAQIEENNKGIYHWAHHQVGREGMTGQGEGPPRASLVETLRCGSKAWEKGAELGEMAILDMSV
jgi:hypothetical protein